MSEAESVWFRMRWRDPGFGRRRLWLFLLIGALWATACGGPDAPATLPADSDSAEPITIYTWTDDQLYRVFDQFKQETGHSVRLVYYNSQDEAVANIRAGKVYDIVVLDGDLVPTLLDTGYFAPIDYRNVPNFTNISADFRDLVHDPGNRYTIPYSWGATGLVVRSDLVAEPVTGWADLWDARYAGRTIAWSNDARETIGAALLTLGYSPNSENPAELEAAYAHLLELKAQTVWLSGEVETSAPYLVNGEAVLALGWAYDYGLAHSQNAAVQFVLPAEGAMLWVDHFAIPANSPRKQAAEQFLNFVLRPEITGQIVNHYYFAMPNDAADPYIDPAIRNNPAIYLPPDALRNAKLILALSPEGQRLYESIWQRLNIVGRTE